MKISALKNQDGVAVIFVLFLVAVMLFIVLSMSAIFIPKLHVTTLIKNSTPATYAAESVLEWCLYKNRIGDITLPSMANGSTYTITPIDCSSSPVKATGTYGGVTRAFELTF